MSCFVVFAIIIVQLRSVGYYVAALRVLPVRPHVGLSVPNARKAKRRSKIKVGVNVSQCRGNR